MPHGEEHLTKRPLNLAENKKDHYEKASRIPVSRFIQWYYGAQD
ncbi:MAG TPA: hypothetical protein VIU12_02340 [Chryseolinea sp.]